MLNSCALRNYYKATNALLRLGASPNPTTKSSPLQTAMHHDHMAIAELLLERGANVSEASEWSSPRNYRNESKRSPMHSAHEFGNLRLFNILVERGITTKGRDWYGLCPLHLSAASGHVQLLERAVELGMPLDMVDNQNCTILHWAAASGKTYLSSRQQTSVQGLPSANAYLHDKLEIDRMTEASFKIENAHQWCLTKPWTPIGLPPIRLCDFDCTIQLFVSCQGSLPPSLSVSVRFSQLPTHLSRALVLGQMSIRTADGKTKRYERSSLLTGSELQPQRMLALNRIIRIKDLSEVCLDKEGSLSFTIKLILTDGTEMVQQEPFSNNGNSNIAFCPTSVKRARCVEYLLGQNLNTSARSVDGWTPLHLAGEKLYQATCTALINAGAGDNA
eukprot:TRINITY_DN14022_c0_g1_i1.p1 TRINITY_DN14022_c0_g1~~TRINITY_DN14022_c0_g1_i1.p1  ORF type:complete len:390 (-),score=29.39 TRINITY_DN14022_c0_g1_i1:66-1235(-)